MKVLVVDDEQNIQRLFEQRFRRERRKGQIVFDFAFSGKEALEYLHGSNAKGLSMILSDINMPHMSGLELLEAIRKRLPRAESHHDHRLW